MTVATEHLTYTKPDGSRGFHWHMILGQSSVWIDRQGTAHALADMTTSHLANALNLAKRHATQISRAAREEYLSTAALADDPVLGPRGDMAQMAVEHELDDLLSVAYPISPWPLIEAMALELQSRP